MNRSHLPAGPKALPFIGHMLDFRRDPIAFFERCTRDYGDVTFIRPPAGRAFVINDAYFINNADFAEDVLIRNHRSFVKSNAYSILKTGLGNGLVSSEGDFWRRQRRLMQPAFHRERIASYTKIMVEDAERLASTWRDGETRELHRELVNLTQEIIIKVMFGTSLGSDVDRIGRAVAAMVAEFSHKLKSPIWIPEYIPTSRNMRWKHAMRQLDALIYGLIEQRRASNQDNGDLLSMLLEAQAEDGSRMTDQQLRDEFLTIFAAGHETSALALTWTWYLLTLHPEVEGRLAEEMRAVLGGRSPTMEDYPRLKYAEMIVKESMRLYPPAWFFGRQAAQDTEVGGYPLKKGMDVWFSPWVIHRDPRYYETPEEFRPERWESEKTQALPKCAYMPFSQGPRQCIGSVFSVVEATMLLATIVQRFQVSVLNSEQIRRVPGISLQPSVWPKVALKARHVQARKGRASVVPAPELPQPSGQA